MKFLITSWSILLLLFFTPVSYAQDNDDEQPPATIENIDPEVEDNRDEVKVERPVVDSKKREEVFIPSEEISEDKPVAFPIDI